MKQLERATIGGSFGAVGAVGATLLTGGILLPVALGGIGATWRGSHLTQKYAKHLNRFFRSQSGIGQWHYYEIILDKSPEDFDAFMYFHAFRLYGMEGITELGKVHNQQLADSTKRMLFQIFGPFFG